MKKIDLLKKIKKKDDENFIFLEFYEKLRDIKILIVFNN